MWCPSGSQTVSGDDGDDGSTLSVGSDGTDGADGTVTADLADGLMEPQEQMVPQYRRVDGADGSSGPASRLRGR